MEGRLVLLDDALPISQPIRNIPPPARNQYRFVRVARDEFCLSRSFL